MYFQKQKQNSYHPKRPLHSFQDLEVYQKTLECSVLVAKEITAPEVVRALPAKSRKGQKGTGPVALMESNFGIGMTRCRYCLPQLPNHGTISRCRSCVPGAGQCPTGIMHSTSDNFGSETVRELIIKNMLPCALAIPHQVAEAHSLRFGDHTAGIAAIEKAMLNCNKMVVYLEQFRDICDSGISWEFFDETIKKYIYVRRKMLRLEQAWKKFMPGV